MRRDIISIENDLVSVPQSDDIWMTRHELADLFGCFVSKVNANIRAILKSEVLDKTDVCRIYHYENGGFIEQYNLEMIVALSFRIKSHNAEMFRELIMKKAIMNTAKRQLLMVGNWNNRNISPN